MSLLRRSLLKQIDLKAKFTVTEIADRKRLLTRESCCIGAVNYQREIAVKKVFPVKEEIAFKGEIVVLEEIPIEEENCCERVDCYRKADRYEDL